MSLKYAVLGLLSISPMTGYEMKKNFDGPLAGFWSVSFGGLYPALHRMTKKGLIWAEELDDARNQKIYHLTEKGQKELAKWYLQKTELPKSKDEFMLKIFMSKDLESKGRIKILEDYIQYKKELLNSLERLTLDEIEDSQVLFHPGIQIVHKYSKLTLQNEIKVLEEIITEECEQYDKDNGDESI